MPFKLAGKLSLKADAFKSGLKKAGSAVKSFGAKAKAAYGGVSAKLGSMWGSAAPIIAHIKQTLDWSAKIRDLANAWGISTKEVQQFQYAARQSGIEIEDVMDNMKDLAKSAGEVTSAGGNEGKASMFKVLGIEVDQLRGKNPAEVFKIVAAAIKEMGDVTTPEALLAIEGLGGGAGMKTLNMMKGDFGGLTDRFNDLGMAVDDVTLDKLGAMSDKLVEVEDRWNSMSAQALGSIMDIADASGDWLSAWHEMGTQGFEDLMLYGQFQKNEDGDAMEQMAATVVRRRAEREKLANARKLDRENQARAKGKERELAKEAANLRAEADVENKKKKVARDAASARGAAALSGIGSRQAGWKGFGATSLEKIGGGLGMKTTQLNVAQQHLALAQKNAERAIAVANNVQQIKDQVSE
jgi:hypothetical protein